VIYKFKPKYTQEKQAVKSSETSVESCAHADPDLLREALRRTDWLFADLKHMDSVAHRARTGAGNELILRNVSAVATAGW
jgi:pyruvate formate lyase activating enzyme